MEKNENIEQLLAAAKRGRCVAASYANRCGIRDPEFIDMAMQEASFRIIDGAAERFDPRLGTTDAYVRRIILNVCAWLNRTFYQRRGLADGYDVGTDDWSPVDRAIRREEIATATLAIGRLPPHLRAAAGRWPGRRKAERVDDGVVQTSTPDVRYFRAKERALREIVAIRSASRTAAG